MSGRGITISGWIPAIAFILFTFTVSVQAVTTTEYGFFDAPEFVSSNGTSASNLQYTVTVGGITYLAGYSTRYNGNDLPKGQATWLVNRVAGNGSIIRLGLTGDEFTKNYGNVFEGYGSQASSISGFTDTGYLYGTSTEYHQGSGNNGTALWVATVTNPVAKRIGLYDYTDPADETPAGNEFTSNLGNHQSQVISSAVVFSITADGWLTGYSTRYNGTALTLGQAAWVANAATGITHRIGLSVADGDTSGEFTADNGTLTTTLDTTALGKQAWNNWGALLGTTARYTGSAAPNGPAALWVARVATGTTARLGLHDAPYVDTISGSTITPQTYTSESGVNDTALTGHTDSGLLWGRTLVYNGGTTSAGQTAWLFDIAAFTPVAFNFSTGAEGETFSQIDGVTADGLAFGRATIFAPQPDPDASAFNLFSALDDLSGLDLTLSATRAFLWDADHGAHLLDAAVLDGTVWQDFLARNDCAYLTDITAITGSLDDLDSLNIFGTGYDLLGGLRQFELQLIPEPSTWTLLAAGLGLLLILSVRRNNSPAPANSPSVKGWPRSGRGSSAFVGKQRPTLNYPVAPRHPFTEGEFVSNRYKLNKP